MSIDSPRLVTVAFHEDPRTFIASLMDELEAAMPGLSVHYHHAEHGIEVMRNDGGRNQLSYRLRHEGTFLGEVTLRCRSRFSTAEIGRFESILARAIPQLAVQLKSLASDASSDIDSDTGLQTRTALLRHLARAPAAQITLLVVRIDDEVSAEVRRRVALQLSAVLADPDRAYAISACAFAIALGETDSPQFLAERIRLMVAAMPTALPAPSVTVALAEIVDAEAAEMTLARVELELAKRADLRNRVVTL
jgi:GGDEF domain-containing protein